MLDSVFTPLAVPRVGDAPIDVRGEADRARTRGYADGFAEGRRIALDQSRQAQQEHDARMQDAEAAFVARAQSALDALRRARIELHEKLDHLRSVDIERIEQLAVELADHVIGAELSDPARSASLALRRAIEAMPIERWTRIAFNAQDLQTLLSDDRARLVLDSIDVVSSDTVGAGGALIAIADGAVDTRVDKAMARVRAALLGDEPEIIEDTP